MKGFLLALRVSTSVSDSFRGLRKWTDIFNAISKGFPPPGLAVAGYEPPPLLPPTFTSPDSLQDKKSEGFLWGVPKRRRSVEKRMTRKFGVKEWVYKMLIPKYNLLICDNCGHHYQAKHLCRNCYEKAIQETKVIREAAAAQFGHSAVDKDVIVLYESDKAKIGGDIDGTKLDLKDKILVEIPKDKPIFFSPNLMQKSTAGANKRTKDVVNGTNPVPIVHKD